MNYEIRDAVVYLINRTMEKRLAEKSVTCCGIVPMPDGSIVLAESATPEQWETAANFLLKGTLDDVEELLEAFIRLGVTRSVYANKESAK